MNAIEILEQVRDTLTVRRVFGEPIERDGVLAIPVACLPGGFGGGGGMEARPVGVYVIREATSSGGRQWTSTA